MSADDAVGTVVEMLTEEGCCVVVTVDVILLDFDVGEYVVVGETLVYPLTVEECCV